MMNNIWILSASERNENGRGALLRGQIKADDLLIAVGSCEEEMETLKGMIESHRLISLILPEQAQKNELSACILRTLDAVPDRSYINTDITGMSLLQSMIIISALRMAEKVKETEVEGIWLKGMDITDVRILPEMAEQLEILGGCDIRKTLGQIVNEQTAEKTEDEKRPDDR